MTTQNYSNQFKQAFINKAMSDVTRYVIEQYFEAMNTGSESDVFASLFSKDVNFYVPDHEKQTYQGNNGYQKVNSCIQELRIMMKSIVFDIKSMDVEGEEAAVLAELTARQRKTDEAIHKDFSFQFTVRSGRITRFRIYSNNLTTAELTGKMQELKHASLPN